MSYLTTQQDMVCGPKPFLPPTPPAAPGGNFIVHEVDGVSKFLLEDGSGAVLQEV